MKKVTVYITCYNYEKYVEKAVESVLNQTFKDYELLIFNDGSTDNSQKILKKYEGHEKITVFNQENMGLARTSNKALEKARGEYILRLDADDYLDENALLVLVNILETKNVDMAYPDYYEINESGDVKDVVRRKKIGEEAKLLDLPSHGACTLIKTKVLRDLGGYSDDIDCQDGYQLWVKFIQEHKAYNVNIPLFYYRKHSESLTTASKKILETRKKIKEEFVKESGKEKETCIIIPVRRDSKIEEDLPLIEVAGKKLMFYAAEEAEKTGFRAIITTEDKEIAGLAEKKGFEVIMRPAKLSKPGTPIEPTIKHVLDELKREGYEPEIVGVVFYTSPLITASHMREAVNTIIIYDADTVIAVTENNRLHYSHEGNGLKPLFEERNVKEEREFLYEESGAFIFSKASLISGKNLTGEKVGHVILTENEAVDIEDKFTLWLARKMLEDHENLTKLEIKKIGRGY